MGSEFSNSGFCEFTTRSVLTSKSGFLSKITSRDWPVDTLKDVAKELTLWSFIFGWFQMNNTSSMTTTTLISFWNWVWQDCKLDLKIIFRLKFEKFKIFTHIFIEIIFSRILSVPNEGPPNGIWVAPNKFAKKSKDQSRPFVWGYSKSVWGHSESPRNTGWQFHNGRYNLIFSVIEIGKMSL